MMGPKPANLQVCCRRARRTHTLHKPRRARPGAEAGIPVRLSKQAAVAIWDGWCGDRTACRWARLLLAGRRPPNSQKDPDGCAFSTQPVRTQSGRLTALQDHLPPLDPQARTASGVGPQSWAAAHGPQPPSPGHNDHQLGGIDTPSANRAPIEADGLPETSGSFSVLREFVLSESRMEASHSTTPRPVGVSKPVDRW